MPGPKEKHKAFAQARKDLKALLAARDLPQKDLAEAVGLSPSNLSARLGRDSVAIFEHIADHYPAASWVAARLFSRLAGIYLEAWEILAAGPEEDFRKGIEDMEPMIDEAEKR
jgi:transcriptional regulator with XRE-family HTH domain